VERAVTEVLRKVGPSKIRAARWVLLEIARELNVE